MIQYIKTSILFILTIGNAFSLYSQNTIKADSVKNIEEITLKDNSRFIVSYGSYGSNKGANWALASENLKKNSGIAYNQFYGIKATSSNGDEFEIGKMFLSKYWLVEFGEKATNLGFCVGPSLNYSYSKIHSSNGNDLGKASYWTVGAYLSEYIQFYLGKNYDNKYSTFIRIGFQQFITYNGSSENVFNLSIGF